MKSLSKLSAILFLCNMTLISVSCATRYYGQMDASVPMEEQCTLKVFSFIGGLTVHEIDGVKVGGFINRVSTISLPAGEHSIDYSYRSQWGGSNNMVYESSGYSSVTYTFISGYDYTMMVDAGGNASFTETKKTFNSVVVTSEWQLGFGGGINYGYDLGFNMPFQVGAIIDSNKLTTGLYADASIIGIGSIFEPNIPRLSTNDYGYSSSAGLSAEFYPPGKAIGGGIGIGITSPLFFTTLNAMYIRGVFIPYKRFAKLKLYFDLYLPETKEQKKDEHHYTRDWGLGLIWFL